MFWKFVFLTTPRVTVKYSMNGEGSNSQDRDGSAGQLTIGAHYSIIPD